MRVGIVAVAQTSFETNDMWRCHELTYFAVEEVLRKAGLPFREGYQAIVTCSSDHWDGKTLSDIEHGEVAGAHLGPEEEKVTIDGINAVIMGYLKILSGHSDVVLVTCACKESQVLDPCVIENFGFDVPYQQPLGLDFTQAAALQAMRFMHKYGVSREDFARVVQKNLKNATGNPHVPRKGEVSVDEVLSSRILSYPISEMEKKPVADGSCALILAREERAKELTKNPVWIIGVGSCYDAHYLGDRDLADPEALFIAAKRAYDMAGIKDPAKEIDLFEISEFFAHEELLWMEGLGLCGRGEAKKLLLEGETSREGRMPVNPSGGLLAGVPLFVAGANRVIEAYLQLVGEAGERKVKKEPTRALAHGTTGPAGQHHAVIILERG